MSQNNWGEIDYERVPSRANLVYNSAFLKHDEMRRREFLGAVQKGEAKINASVLFPHDIVHKYSGSRGWFGYSLNPLDAGIEALWKAQPDLVDGNDSTIVVADGSGSMTSCVGGTSVTALEVANALASGWRYVLMNLNSFSGQKFKDVEASFGWTYRKNPQAGLTWSPEQVVQQMNLTSDAKNTVCALIDLKECWVKVIDYDYNGIPIANTRGNINGAYCQFYAKDPELNVELILKLNAGARKASEIMSLSDYEIWKDAELFHIKEMNKIRKAEGTLLEAEVIDESNVIFFKYEDFLADYTKLLSLI
jgi:hypothetical protein